MPALLTPREMDRADRLAVEGGIASARLMDNAGRAVAAHIATHYPAGRVVVVAGPGNNGGDGYVAARLLAVAGRDVRVLRIGAVEALKGDAAQAARAWEGFTAEASAAALHEAAPGVVIDAIFGAGLARPVEGETAAIIEAINAAGCPVVAVDLPSGIDGESGMVLGVAVRATCCVTFFRRKPGHLLLPGRDYAGAVHVADIGIPVSVLETIAPRCFENSPTLWESHFPRPGSASHKYTRGHAVVVSGGLESTGAARLAARAALRVGAGLVTIATPREALAVHAASNLAVMVRPVDGATELAAFLQDERRNAVVLGPGGGVGAAMRTQVRAALGGPAMLEAAGRAVVLDADALSSFADRAASLAKGVREHHGTVVLTPHSGEFSRLFKSIEEISNVKSKHEKARLSADFVGAVVVYKGADTVVAAPDGRVAIAANAPPWLATAGSGDVLAGLIGGLLAQGMPGFEAAAAAVWLHGEAAARFGPGLIAEDLPELLPAVLRPLVAPHLFT